MQELINMFRAIDALAIVLPIVGCACALWALYGKLQESDKDKL